METRLCNWNYNEITDIYFDNGPVCGFCQFIPSVDPGPVLYKTDGDTVEYEDKVILGFNRNN